jgi:hypothetical protein
MNEQQAKNKIQQAGGSWKTFKIWMNGQTCPILGDGSLGYYDYDVDRFIRYKCDPKNEPLSDFD